MRCANPLRRSLHCKRAVGRFGDCSRNVDSVRFMDDGVRADDDGRPSFKKFWKCIAGKQGMDTDAQWCLRAILFELFVVRTSA